MALIHTNPYLAVFHYYQGLGERAMGQVSDEQLFPQTDAESNSIAIIVKHVAAFGDVSVNRKVAAGETSQR